MKATEDHPTISHLVPNPLQTQSPGVLLRLGALLGLACIGLLGGLAYLSREPDFSMEWSREVRSEEAYEVLSYRMGALKEWPHWFYSLSSAVQVDSNDQPLPDELQNSRSLTKGVKILFKMDPHKGPQGHFEIWGVVTAYEPGRKIEIRILSESSGRLMRLFSDLTWKVQLTRRGEHTLILGEETAHTVHWRSRLFGRLAPRVLMHQAFYPSVIALGSSETTRPPDWLGQ